MLEKILPPNQKTPLFQWISGVFFCCGVGSFQYRKHTVPTAIATVQNKGGTSAGVSNHFGFDVAAKEPVDDCEERVKSVQEQCGIQKITRPVQQHGTYWF